METVYMFIGHIYVWVWEEKKERRSEEREVFLFFNSVFYWGDNFIYRSALHIKDINPLVYTKKSPRPPHPQLGNLNHRIETGEKIFYLHH